MTLSEVSSLLTGEPVVPLVGRFKGEVGVVAKPVEIKADPASETNVWVTVLFLDGCEGLYAPDEIRRV